jgi:hypothetical protein
MHYNSGDCPLMSISDLFFFDCHVMGALPHWHRNHAESMYNAPSHYICRICKFGVPSKVHVAHLRSPYGNKRDEEHLNFHAARMAKLRLLWHIDNSHINPNPAIRALLTLSELKSASKIFPAVLKDHLIFVSRHSGSMKGLRWQRVERLVRISARSAIALRRTKAIDFESFAVIDANNCKGRMMPLFATDPETERRLF